jgi:carbon-monoxide dehydrogenase iron sulfur subunit
VTKAIFTFLEKCVACKGCEIACAVAHSRSKDLFLAMHETPRTRPRVRVQPAGAFSYPARCQHCQEAACVAACPMGAMTRDLATGAVVVDNHRCVGCWMCVTVCAFGGVTADASAKQAHKCDLCPERTAQGLEPACVAACPTRALILATPEEMADHRRKLTALAVVAGAPAVSNSVASWRTLKGA